MDTLAGQMTTVYGAVVAGAVFIATVFMLRAIFGGSDKSDTDKDPEA